MSSVLLNSPQAAADRAVAMVDSALGEVLGGRPGAVSASAETAVQNALDLLRRSACNAGTLARIERISAILFTMSQARVNGRPNLYASQLLRLKRLVAA